MKKYLYILACLLMAGSIGTVSGRATYRPTEKQTYCKGTEDPGYSWHNKYYRTTGTYQHVDVNPAGDSTVYTLDLTVNHVFDSIIELPICKHGSVEYNGKTYTTETEEIVYQGIRESNGCDSIIRIKSFFAESYHRYDTIQISYHRTPTEWHGMVITGPGTYVDQNFNMYGCDSTYELHVTVADSIAFLNITKDVICEKDTVDYEWRGHKYSYTGVIMEEEKYKTEDGRDSIYSLYLVVQPQYEFTYNINLCPNTTVEYRGKIYSQDSVGVHYDTLYTSEGCDSICKINVAVLEGGKLENVTIKEGDSYLWQMNGTVYTSSGRYAFPEIPESSEEGCDLTNYLLLSVTPTFNVDPETVLHCRSTESPTYLWRGKHYGTTGTYYDTLRVLNVLIPDTVYTLILTVGDPKETHEYMELCQAGEGKTWHDNPVTEAGDYRLYLQTREGCDSIVILHVTNNLIEDIYDTLSYKDRKPWYEHTVGGSDTIYIHRVLTNEPDMCDTLKRLHVALCYPFKTDMSDTICETRLIAGETYMWEDVDGTKVPLRLNRDANLRYRDSVFYTCDRQWKFHLHVLRERIKMDTIDLCEGESVKRVLSDGRTVWLSEPGRTYDTIPEPGRGRFACDSVVCYFVQVHKPKRDTVIVHLPDTTTQFLWETEDKEVPCPIVKDQREQYFNDTVLSTLRSTCDSIIHTLKVITDKTYLFTADRKEICQPYYHGPGDPRNTPFIWEGHLKDGKPYEIYEAGIYWDSLRTADTNVDSVYRLEVIVYPTYHLQYYKEICQGDFLTSPLGKIVTKAGIYYDTLLTEAHGCDSIIEWIVNEKPTYQFDIYKDIADRENFTWTNYDADGTEHSRSLSRSGVYNDTLVSSRNCDSIITLHLTVHNTYFYKDSISICASETPYTWMDIEDIYESGWYKKEYRTQTGFDSIYMRYINVRPSSDTLIYRTICEGGAYHFNGMDIEKAGEYRDTLLSVNGCDSVVTLYLNVHPRYHDIVAQTIGEGETIVFQDSTITTSGHYLFRYTSVVSGCDSLIELRLTVLTTGFRDTTARVCANELPFIWRGTECSAAGDYSLRTTWNDNAHIVTTLHLEVLPAFYEERNIDICEGTSYIYKNHIFKTSGHIYDTIRSEEGCDSILKISVSVHPKTGRIDTVHISDKQNYTFHDSILTVPGTYTWTGTSLVTGCDSIERLILAVHPTYFFDDTVGLCQADTLRWHNKLIVRPGTYVDSLRTSQHGYDSIYQLTVFTYPSYEMIERYELGNGDTLHLHGQSITRTGVYMDTLTSVNGCDSIYKIIVNPKRTFEVYRNEAICQGNYYDFYGERLTRSGSYTYNSPMNDSIIHLKLTVYPSSLTEKRVVITNNNLPYIYNGKLYEEGGIYHDTSVNQYWCDSITRLVLIVTDRYSDWDRIPLCTGSEIRIDNEVITEAGLYSFPRQSKVTGDMDSLYRVEVYNAPAYDLPTEYREICEGDTAFYGGKAYTRTGRYDIPLKTVEGCDSLLHLDLVVYPSYHFVTDATIRDFEKYVWQGKTYTETGEYTRVWPTIHNCDSIYTLRLTVIPTTRESTVDTICDGTTYNWRGGSYTLAGYYTDTVFRPETFYSAIYTLQLTTVRPTTILTAKVDDICADAEEFGVEFTYTGSMPDAYSIYFDQAAKRQGFTDIINKPFTSNERIAYVPMPVRTEVVYQGHTKYVRPDRYSLRLVVDNGVCGISRSDSIKLLIKYPSWIIEQNWDDVVAPLKKEYNGGYEFIQTEWYVNNDLQPGMEGYLHNDALHIGDQVVMYATRKGENYAIPTCPLTITGVESTGMEHPAIVYPTQASRHAPVVTVETSAEGLYELYNSAGWLISKGTLREGATVVTLPAVSGVYFIRTIYNEEAQTHKVLIY